MTKNIREIADEMKDLIDEVHRLEKTNKEQLEAIKEFWKKIDDRREEMLKQKETK